MTQPGIVLILSGFPRRSETFALQEALALHRRGLLAAIFATKPGDALLPQPGTEELRKRVVLLPKGSPATQATFAIHRLADRTVAGVHAYFAHTPTDVAISIAQRLNVPYSFSMHAKDARKITRSSLIERARGAACVIACNPDVAREIDDATAPLHLLPHGVDTRRFQPRPFPANGTLRLLAVGRLVEKKGFDVLIRAVARLGFPFTLDIVGEGPERPQLEKLIAVHRLAESVRLCGGVTHAELPALYTAAHVVVVPSVVDQDGDRDGLPNVLLEAMASGRPVVASDVAAIRNAITPAKTGLLVPPGNEYQLAKALNALMLLPELRSNLAQNARELVVRDFDLQRCTDRFCDFLATTYGIESHNGRFMQPTILE